MLNLNHKIYRHIAVFGDFLNGEFGLSEKPRIRLVTEGNFEAIIRKNRNKPLIAIVQVHAVKLPKSGYGRRGLGYVKPRRSSKDCTILLHMHVRVYQYERIW